MTDKTTKPEKLGKLLLRPFKGKSKKSPPADGSPSPGTASASDETSEGSEDDWEGTDFMPADPRHPPARRQNEACRHFDKLKQKQEAEGTSGSEMPAGEAEST